MKVIKTRVKLFLTLLFLISLSCRERVSSDLSLRQGLDQELIFSEHEAQDICSRDILIFYAGNAEGLGPVHYLPKLLAEFGEDNINRDVIETAIDEVDYFYEIDLQARNLYEAIAAPNRVTSTSGRGVAICERIKLTKPGRIVLVQITDGPNKYVIEGSGGQAQVVERQADSEIRVREFKFVNARWQESKTDPWPMRLATNPVRPIKTESTEVYFPRDLWAIQEWLAEQLKHLGYAGGFDQSLFMLKSHGAQRTYAQDPNGVPFYSMIVPQASAASSVFMFDHDTSVAPRGYQTNYFVPLWSDQTICELASLGDQSKSEACLKRLRIDLEREGQTQGARSYRNPLASLALGPGLRHGQVQGSFAENVIFGGGPTRPREKNFEYLPYEEVTYRPYKVTQPLHRDDIARINLEREQLAQYPEAYRFLGNGIALMRENEQQTELRLLPGNRHASLVVLDTCSVNMAPIINQGKLPWMRNAQVPLAVLSNPMPLFAKAIDYGTIDGFQLAYLATLLGKADEPNLERSERSKIDRILAIMQSGPELAEDESISFMRLRLSLFKCPPGQQRCHAYRPLSTVFAFEPAYLALQKLHDQVELLLKEGGSVDYGTFHALTTAFADGLFRLLEGGSLEQSYLSSRISSPSRGETLGPLLGGMNANFELRHRIPQFVNQHQDMQKVLKLWSYYAEDVLFTLRTTDFSDHWNKIFENGVLEELIITDLRLVGALISSSLTYEKETGSLPERERHLLNRSVPKLLRSYSHLTRAFSPAYPKLRSLRYRSDIFENRAYLAKLLEALEM